MLAFIKGILNDIIEDIIIIESNNIGYEVRVPLSVISQLPTIGNDIKIHTYLYVREDAMSLYGFLTRDDLTVFKLLITVSGIGPKGALGILSTVTPDELRFAVIADDVKTISKSPGIGKKTAQKLILELKDKLSISDTLIHKEVESNSNDFIPTDIKTEAIQALTTLGYTSTEAVKAVKDIEINDNTQVEYIIKEALKKLSLF
ncbi:Holliday junction DNA helicase subunit RuvA [Natranaerovirga pectinivora]|uniref:Holliday junction branch migration complex subunit RuvA n=1 Tax=Natranaerovirga pectinivora TaxID=682400 RepID=A0A4V2V0N9_9FIRM|nr:Holliday junction branch migration protein RuvA [Natranaerovirga pectinivora]TCT17089.1 Holliday junction DNA helicase subunit RuvA [Natranaerovirga pectinivora]